MKQSGHMPYSWQEFIQEFGTNAEEFIKKNDARWRKALRFYK